MDKKWIIISVAVLILVLIGVYFVSEKAADNMNKPFVPTYSFPVSADVPKKKPDPVPTYIIPSTEIIVEQETATTAPPTATVAE